LSFFWAGSFWRVGAVVLVGTLFSDEKKKKKKKKKKIHGILQILFKTSVQM